MPHPSIEELVEQLRAAREAGAPGKPSPEKVKLLRELLAACPTSTPGTLALARALLVTEEPGVSFEESFAEIQRLLEQAIEISDRSAPALIEKAYLIDTFHGASDEARKLFEEGAAKALASLEDAWAGLLSILTEQEQWSEALAIAAQAEPLFPDSVRIIDAVEQARELAARAARKPPSDS